MTAQKHEILAIGHCCVDFIYSVTDFLAGEGKTEAAFFDMQPGGPAANAIVAATRLGAKTAFIGQAGDDPHGEFICHAFQAENVEFICPHSENNKTRVATCLVHQQTGARQVYVNTIAPISPDPLPFNLISAFKLLLFDGHELPFAKIAAQHAIKLEIPIVIGAGSLRPGIPDLLPFANTMIISEKFAQSYLPNALPEQVVQRLHADGTKTAILTLGAQGSIGYDGENIYRIPAVKVNIVDTTGAGDAYLGAFYFTFLQNWALPEKMKFATFVAAEKCKHLGGRRGLPYRTNLKNEFVFK
ncbi:MAG: carbohydrate kinase family protein [bacterium]